MRIKMPHDNKPRFTREERDRIIESLEKKLSEDRDKKLFRDYMRFRKRKDYLHEKDHANIMYEYIFSKSTLSAFLLLCSFSAYNALSSYMGYEVNILVNLIILFFGVALIVNNAFLYLRIKGGLFCNNGYEAREFILFILKNMKDNDYDNSSGGKPAFPEDVVESEKPIVTPLGKGVVAK